MQLFDKNGNIKNLQEYNLSTIEDKGKGVTYVVGYVELGGNTEEHLKKFLESLISDKHIIFDVIVHRLGESHVYGFKYPRHNYIIATEENYYGHKVVHSCNNGVWSRRTI